MDTVCKLCLVLLYWYAWDMMIANPSATYMSNWKLFQGTAHPTNIFANKIFAAGLSDHIGTECKPSFALPDRHIHYFDK